MWKPEDTHITWGAGSNVIVPHTQLSMKFCFQRMLRLLSIAIYVF